jgi:alpha-galactosidase
MLIFIASVAISRAIGSEVSLSDFNLSSMTAGWGAPQKNLSIGGNQLKIGGQSYASGVGTHAESEMTFRLNKNAIAFHAKVGMDDETGADHGSADFQIYVDGRKVADSGPMHTGDTAKDLNVDLKGAGTLKLEVSPTPDGINFAHADWADAEFDLIAPGKTIMPMVVEQEPTMKIAHMNLTKTEINGARVEGCTPGHEFIFRIPATGMAPLKFEATGLPSTIALDASTGVLRGTAPDAGTYEVNVKVSGPGGVDHRTIKILSGDHMLAMTPPMGWNSWNVWGTTVTADKVRAAADAFEKSHLADYGYTFVNIDDAWEGGRDENGMIKTNAKFGDMAALASYIHSRGLKLGIYSSPGPTTCAGYTASYEHEAQDAKTYADWGVDYLKYDWCSFGSVPHPEGLSGYELPYETMRKALDEAPRDITYSLCQYGMGDVYKWGHSEVGGNLWRTTGDINDSWSSMSSIGFSHSIRSTYVKPGGWNDPDMLVVGKLGWGAHPRETKLTGNEQITHISLWSMLAAPLIIGCDLTQLDSFTSDLLMNPDVISVDQDPLGHAAVRIGPESDLQIWARPLEDGGFAVGLFNLGSSKAKMTANWEKDLHVEGRMKIRDLWQRKNAGSGMEYSAMVPAHGAVLIKVWK